MRNARKEVSIVLAQLLTPTETGFAQVVGHLQLYQANA